MAAEENVYEFAVDGLSAKLTVRSVEGVEGVSELFRWNLVCTSEDKLVAFSDVIGKPGVLTIHNPGGEPRYVSGMVSRFRQNEEGLKIAVYHLTIVPKLWRLQHRADSRIFQEKN